MVGFRWKLSLVMLVLMVASCEDEVDPKCESACDWLDRCRMLPSVLGKTAEECTERCNVSGGEVKSILSCFPGPEVEATGNSCSDRCELGASCLQNFTTADQEEGDAEGGSSGETEAHSPFTGTSSLRVIPCTDECPNAPGKNECKIANQCDDVLSQEAANDLCGSNFSMVAIQIKTGSGVYRSDTRGCVEMLSNPTRFRDVGWGDVSASVFFLPARTAPAEGDDAASEEPSQCKVFNVLEGYKVGAGECHAVFVNVGDAGTPQACEEGESACSDNEDNDGDGRRNCDSLTCAAACSDESSADAAESDDDTASPGTSPTAIPSGGAPDLPGIPAMDPAAGGGAAVEPPAQPAPDPVPDPPPSEAPDASLETMSDAGSVNMQ